MSERAIALYLNQAWPRYEYRRMTWGHSIRARKRHAPRPSWLVRLNPPSWAKPLPPLEGVRTSLREAVSAMLDGLDAAECHL